MRKRDNIPTEPLFDIGPYVHAKPRPARPPKSIAQGNCPGCLRAKIGLVMQGTHLVWRMHTYQTWSGATMPCRAVGIAVCQLPESQPRLNAIPLRCKHD